MSVGPIQGLHTRPPPDRRGCPDAETDQLRPCPQATRGHRLGRADARRHGRRRAGLRGARPALQRPRQGGLGGQPGDPPGLRQRRRDAADRARRPAPGGHDRAPGPGGAARAGGEDEARRSRARAWRASARPATRRSSSKDGRTAFVYAFPPRGDDPFGGNVDAMRARAGRGRGREGRRRRPSTSPATTRSSTPPARAPRGRACCSRRSSAASARSSCSRSSSARGWRSCRSRWPSARSSSRSCCSTG